MNMSNLEQLLTYCTTYAKDNKHEFVTIEHLLLGIVSIDDETVGDLVEYFNINAPEIQNQMIMALKEYDQTANSEQLGETPALHRVLMRADANARLQSVSMEPVDVLLSIMYEDESVAAFHMKKYISVDDLMTAIQDFREIEFHNSADVTSAVKATKESRKMKKAHAALDKYCDNFNDMVGENKIDPLIGRYDEIGEVTKVLARRKKNNVILVGEEGVGKTAVAEGLAYRIVHGDVAHTLKDSIVYSLNMSSLIAGAKYRGEFEERLNDIVEALKMLADDGESPILFIDEIHTINGAGAGGSQGNLDMANMLKPALSSGMKCIGSTTSDEYRKTFDKDKALSRRFQLVRVGEPSIDETIEILEGIAPNFEEFHGVTFEAEALRSAVELTAKFIHDKRLPDKAIDIIDRVGAATNIARGELEPILSDEERATLKATLDIQLERDASDVSPIPDQDILDRIQANEENGVEIPESTRPDPIVITKEMIEEEVAVVAKIPKSTFDDQEEATLSGIDTRMKETVFGQDNAVEELVESYLMARAGLRDPHKPIGSYLFTGPTGVGKTEVAKTLAAQLKIPLHRFDMSEYMEKHTVSKLIGSPPGYVGYEEEGQLIKAIEDNPNGVLLLDEIEKAHPSIFNILLQVMDNGELTSSKGKVISFRNTIVVMTSNAGAAEANKSRIGFGSSEGSASVIQDKAIEKLFTPEFRNRLDAVVKFDSLSQDTLYLIVDKFINQLNERSADRGVFVEVSVAAKDKLLKMGYDPKMGARPMDRVIQEHITKKLSREILFGSLKDGGIVNVDAVDDDFTLDFKVKTPEPVV